MVEDEKLLKMVNKPLVFDFAQEIRQAAEFLELPKLIYLLSNLKSDNSALSEETSLHYSAVRKNSFSVNFVHGFNSFNFP